MVFERLEMLKDSDKSKVYLVYDPERRQMLVEKHLSGDLQELYCRLQQLSHPYLPQVHDVRFENGQTIVLEEYISGGSLAQTAASEKQIVCWMIELCQVLSFLHKYKILHRDIKPSNLLVGEDGHIRLIDFDSAREERDEAANDTRLLGTKGYAPPEQYGFSQTDARADIYAVGVTLKTLIGAKAEKSVYRRIIRKCTEFAPERRYETAQALAWALKTRVLRQLFPWIAAALCFACCLGLAVWYQQNTAKITEERYPDEPLLLYSVQGDYIIARVEELRTGGAKYSMEVDMDRDGKKELVELYAAGEEVRGEFTSGVPVQDGLHTGMDLVHWMTNDVPLWERLNGVGHFAQLPDDYYLQITCLDLDGGAKEFLVSVGDMGTECVTAVYTYPGTKELPAEYRGAMWGANHINYIGMGNFDAELLQNPYLGVNSYLYTDGCVQVQQEVDYNNYQSAVHGKLSLQEWHNAFASKDALRALIS